MCPACIAGVAWIVGGVMTTGGAGIVAKAKLRGKRILKFHGAKCEMEKRRNDHGKRNEQAADTQSRDAA